MSPKDPCGKGFDPSVVLLTPEVLRSLRQTSERNCVAFLLLLKKSILDLFFYVCERFGYTYGCVSHVSLVSLEAQGGCQIP